MSEVQAPVTTEREITIYATRGGQMKKIMTSATTWGELQPLVRREGFDLSSLLAAENINKSDLVNDLAVLPATAFRLFLRPKQTKSGALDRKECFAAIKAHIAVYPADKSKFTIDGKNMTQLSTQVVQDLVAKFCKVSVTQVIVPAPVKEKAPKVEKVKEVETVKESKAEKPCVAEATSNGVPVSDAERVQEAIKLISTLEGHDAHYKANKHLNNLLAEVTPPEMREETEEEAIRREAKEMGY
jgi:hypothetical protein